jgi:hypothetical protein
MELISILAGSKLNTVNKLTNNHVLHINDVFDQEYVDYILTKGTPYCIVSDHMSAPPYHNPIPFYGLPLFAENNTRIITNQLEFDNNLSTSHCFNFMINKKQVNRFLCIKLVEYFKLTDFDYTWSAVDQTFDMSEILKELDALGSQSPLDNKTRSAILAPINLTKRFIKCPPGLGTKSNSSVMNYGGNAWTWKNGLNDLFSKSAISLITESVRYQQSMTFTEKTLYSVLGLTFPIWIGGYNQASEWEKLGFDAFNDVVDHSYQSYNTLIERCYYAFSNNLELLTNKSKSAELRAIHQERLFKNRELLLQNQLGKFVDTEINKYPSELQLCVPEILKHFRK